MTLTHRNYLHRLAFAVSLSTFGWQAIQAQTFTTTTLIDTNTPRPDGQGNFNVFWTVPAVIQGDTIVFLNSDATTEQYWVYNTTTNTETMLVDFSTTVPGGSGTFTNFVPPNNNLTLLNPKLRNGYLVFWGVDAAGGDGIYAIKTTGGPITRVVNYLTPSPDGGVFSFINSFSISATSSGVIFNANGNVYTTTFGGAAPNVVADVNTQILINGGPFDYGCFGGVAIQGTTVAVIGSNCFDPSTGWNVIFAGPQTGFASLNKLPVVNSGQSLPGDSNGTPHLDVESGSIFLSGNELYFTASDTTAVSPGYFGLFYAPFGANGAPLSPTGSPIFEVFNNVNTGISDILPMAIDSGSFAFVAMDAQGAKGFFLASGPNPLEIALETFNSGQPAAPMSLSAGRVAFTSEGFFNAQLNLITPNSCPANLTSQVTIQHGALKAGTGAGMYTEGVKVTNSGAKAIAGPALLELTGLTPGALLVNRTGVSACTPPAGTPYVTLNLGASNTLNPGASATVTLDFYIPVKGFTYQPAFLAGVGLP